MNGKGLGSDSVVIYKVYSYSQAKYAIKSKTRS